MELLEQEDFAQFERTLRAHKLRPTDFTLNATDTTDPKTDEIPGIQGEITVLCKFTGQEKHYLISDNNSWLDLFIHDLQKDAFIGQSALSAAARQQSAKTAH